MAYIPTVWENAPSAASPMSAANLNKLTNEFESEATEISLAHTLPNWVNDGPPALTDVAGLNEMERVCDLVAADQSLTYTPTVWQAGWTPARNAANLNKLEAQAAANRAALDEAPPPPGGRNIILVDQQWNVPSGNWGHYDLVDVRIMDTSVRRDAIQLNGSGTVSRVYIEQHSGDGLKTGQAVTGPVVLGEYNQQSEIIMYEKRGAVHQDNHQSMGGLNVTLVGFYSKKWTSSNSCFFANEGAGGNGKPTDIVYEFSVLDGYEGIPGVHDGGVPLKIYDSIRCGMRHSLVVHAATSPGPIDTTPSTVDPVLVDCYFMTHGPYIAAGRPRHRDLWNADGSHKALLNTLISNGSAQVLTVNS